MLFLLLSSLTMLAPTAVAADQDVPAVSTKKVDYAEYVRLSQELEKLAKRDAWAGVERTYQACLATGASLSFDDHKYGAHAAQALGDVTAARRRLVAANEIREDPEILNWLWEIDSSYGMAFIAGDAGKVELGIESMPFNPSHAKSVAFAIEQVAQTGLFDGYLPSGTYTFQGLRVRVQPRVQAVRVDLRTDEGGKKKKKRAKPADAG